MDVILVASISFPMIIYYINQSGTTDTLVLVERSTSSARLMLADKVGVLALCYAPPMAKACAPSNGEKTVHEVLQLLFVRFSHDFLEHQLHVQIYGCLDSFCVCIFCMFSFCFYCSGDILGETKHTYSHINYIFI